MRKGKISFITIGFILIFLAISYIYVFKDILRNPKYGKSANSIREYVRVPVIEPGMRMLRRVNRNERGGKWEAKDEKNGLAHLWKIVSPNSGNYILYEEADMFRKYVNSEVYWHLNIYSKIAGDSISTRTGTLGFYNKNLVNEYDLDENGLDSLFRSWRLDNLVKK